MKNHKGCIRGYDRHSKAWYAEACNDALINVEFGMYAKDGSTIGEMAMEWVELKDKLYARLKCFEGGWGVLALFTDLIQKLGEVDGKQIQEEDFVKILNECGFKDLTAYERK